MVADNSFAQCGQRLRQWLGSVTHSPPIGKLCRTGRGASPGNIGAASGNDSYGRRGNPTNGRLSKVIADLEGGEAGMVFASGMGAISTTLMALLGPGDHVVAQQCHYIGIGEMVDKVLPRCGVQTTRVDQRSIGDLEQAIKPNTKLMVLETPVNPLMHLTDLRAIAEIATARGVLTFCDNTFATPINQRPLKLA